jgi:uncharacterized protein (TIGR02001 family)
MAQDDEGIGIELSANVALVSEYRFRGVNLSGGDIAIQGGVDVSLPAGFYFGTWASSIDEDTVGFGHTELDVYGGWAGEFGSLSTDVGVIVYLYPNAGPMAGPLGDGGTDYAEAYASLGLGLGPVELSVGTAYAWEQDTLGGNDNLYVYGDVSVGVPGTPVSATAHIGYTDGFLTFTNDSQAFDYSVALESAIPGSPVSIGIAYVGVDGDVLVDPDGTFTDDSVVATLSASF